MIKPRKILQSLNQLRSLMVRDIQESYLDQYFPSKPSVINFNANDICNSKCVMCNIWKKKKNDEISPADLKSILSNDLYSSVKSVGITGGEPTLREDLPELFKVVCDSLPSLRQVSIITNGIQADHIINQLKEIENYCSNKGISFGVMVSLDGVKNIHDLIRGRKNNFDSAIRVIEFVRNNFRQDVQVGVTISKDNVWYMDDLLVFLKKHKYEARFRIAEFINRLYNEDLTSKIRNFNEEETFYLSCFFKKIQLTYEKNEVYNRTYENIIRMLNGDKRSIGCPYQSKGVVLNSKAELQYCAPKSKIIGNAIEEKSIAIYRKNLKERRRILHEDCTNCIHDYHSQITLKEKLLQYKTIAWKSLIKIENIHLKKIVTLLIKTITFNSTLPNSILITGWYGTETTGDKAILGGIINKYRKQNPQSKFIISSIYPFITRKTIRELNINAEVVYPYSAKFLILSAKVDKVIMGGGPLMDTDYLSLPLWSFLVGKSFNRNTIIEGCGLGPIRNLKYKKTVSKILSLADIINLRDRKSIEFAKKLKERNDYNFTGDPAKDYVQHIATSIKSKSQKNQIVCFIREWSTEYTNGMSLENYLQERSKFEERLSEIIKKIARTYNVQPVFYPMHTFVVGQDDRDFFRNFSETHFKKEEITIHNRNSSVQDVLQIMSESKYCLCMRFHSVLFAETIGANYFAIDYTNGGKISAFMEDQNKLNRMLTLNQFTSLEFSQVYDRVQSTLLDTLNIIPN